MKENPISRSVWRYTTLAICVGVCTLTPASADGDSVYGSGLFELGDTASPAGFPGAADILADPEQGGPDWAELFTSEGRHRDDYPYDELGQPLGNGIPDFIDLYGGSWAVFTADDVSLGSGFESSTLTGDGRVANGTASAEHDLGNTYVYSTQDAAGNLVLYAGIERLGLADSRLEIEINQEHFRLGKGGYGRGEPWQINGDRRAGDLLIKTTFLGGTVGTVEVSSWDGQVWTAAGSLASQGCNAAETVCAIANAVAIDGGAWPSHGELGQIEAQRFVELGVNAGGILGVSHAYKSIQIRTPEDIAFGYFGEGN